MLEKMHGDYGLGVLGSTISVKRLNRDTFTTIVRVQREGADLMLTSIPLVRQLHDLPCTIRTLHVSGTINGCLRRLQRIHKSQIKQHLAQSNKDKTDPTTVATKKSPNKDDVCDSDNK